MDDGRGTADDRRYLALDRLLAVTVLLGADMKRRLARDGLTESRAHLLWVLRRGGPVPQRALADAMRVSPRTVTGLVDGLMASGHVTRRAHPSDRRATLVTFTDAGARAVAALEREQAAFAALLFDDMPADRFTGLVDGLGDVLDRISAALEVTP